jgi:hypothetical protein
MSINLVVKNTFESGCSQTNFLPTIFEETFPFMSIFLLKTQMILCRCFDEKCNFFRRLSNDHENNKVDNDVLFSGVSSPRIQGK